MEILITQVIAWPTFGIALAVFGFAPGVVLRLILLAFKRDDPRRTELLAELPHVPRIERPFWVCEQLEVALSEGLVGRVTERAAGKRRRKAYKAAVENLLTVLGDAREVPSLHSRDVPRWTAPDLAGYGGVSSVSREGIRSGARQLWSKLEGLDTAVTAAENATCGLVSLQRWPDGLMFVSTAASDGRRIAQAARLMGDKLYWAGSNLQSTASLYEAVEAGSAGEHGGAGPVLDRGAEWQDDAPSQREALMRVVSQPSISDMSASQIMGILHALDPVSAIEAGAAHTQLSDMLIRLAEGLASTADDLARDWLGNAAQAAMSAFQALYDASVALAGGAGQAGAVLTWLGEEILPRFKDLPDPSLPDRTADLVAREYLTALNEYLLLAEDALTGGQAALVLASGFASVRASALSTPSCNAGSEHVLNPVRAHDAGQEHGATGMDGRSDRLLSSEQVKRDVDCVFVRHVLGRHIRQGPRDPEDLASSAGADASELHQTLDLAQRADLRQIRTANLRTRDLGVHPPRCAPQPSGGTLPGGGHPFSDDLRRLCRPKSLPDIGRGSRFEADLDLDLID